MSLHSRLFHLLLALTLAIASLSASARGHYGGDPHRSSHYSHHYNGGSNRRTGFAYHYGRSPRLSYRPHSHPRPVYRTRGRYHRSHSHYGDATRYSRHPHTRRAFGVRRDRHGRIARSREAKWSFKHSHPCPSTGRTSGRCPGYVIDHVRALQHGGADTPRNMQWQTRQAAKAKDRWE